MSSFIRSTLSLSALIVVAGACAGDAVSSPEPIVATGPSRAYSLWTPGPNDTCTKEQHDAYSVVGPDGKLYPTWHPPVDPQTGCAFGHEHGRDPHGSNLYRIVGDMPLGVANEALETWDPANPRREDHVGHKIEWENNLRMRVNTDVASAILEVTCDVMIKLHQGTHSKDAFTNNLHEMVYHIRCNDGAEAHLTFMAAIGPPGEFTRSCNQAQHVSVGPATPPNSPNGGGQRIIPDADCVQQFLVNNAEAVTSKGLELDLTARGDQPIGQAPLGRLGRRRRGEPEEVERLGLLHGRTAVLISHRVAAIKDAEQILVIDQGQIVDRGTHAELIARGGVYADLYRTQLESELQIVKEAV